MGNDKELQDALRPLFRGELRPVIDSVFPLADARGAHQKIESRRAFGKILLKP
jgi:NADPH2:quinone reductase